MANPTKNSGGTPAEQYLAQLGERSFLSLWTYPSPFRDQDTRTAGGDGKELCDMLVVFDEHVIIFSSKHCEYPTTDNPVLNWSRWYKRAVAGAADQLFGAERWLRQHPNRVFLDKACQQPFPVPLPATVVMKVHRIVVAHGASGPCQAEFGGTGSLILDNRVAGAAHYDTQRFTPQPFTLGLVQPQKEYVHVFDDASLAAVMHMLDTITDFVTYLKKKEELLTKRNLQVWAAGEDDLLAYYLRNTDHDEASPTFGRHCFPVSAGYSGLGVDEGHWSGFVQSPEFRTRQAANKASYAWDGLINFIYKHTSSSKAHAGSTDTSFASREAGLRIMARESRLSRRMLARAFRHMIEHSEPDQYHVRHTGATADTGAQYVFLLLPRRTDQTEADYRHERFEVLQAYCLTIKYRNFGKTKRFVGIATEAGGFDALRSYDLMYLEGDIWAENERELAEQASLLFFNNAVASAAHEDEYPVDEGDVAS